MNELQLARMVDQARAMVEDEKFLHAIQLYLKLIFEEPMLALPYIELAALYAQTGQASASIQLLERAQKLMPDNEEVIFALGNYYLRHEQFDLALTQYKKLSSRRLPQVHFNMGVAYFYQDNIKQAEEQFRTTLRYDPAFPKINESLGELLIRREAYTEAIACLKRGIDIDPYSALNHYLLGMAYSRTDRWKKAHEEFILAVDMDPNEPANWQMCGESLIKLGQFKQAEPYLRKALELYPQSVDTLVDLSHVLQMQGDDEHALEFSQRAAAIDPQHTRLREAKWKYSRPRGPVTQRSKP